jgi:hypothetical protein
MPTATVTALALLLTSSSFAADIQMERPGFSPTADMRLALDISTQHQASTADGDWDGLGFIGLDLFTKLSGPRTDWGELLLQPYLLRVDQWEEKPPFIEEETHWEPILRFAYLDVTGPFKGMLALRTGHIGIPFGLRLPVNTTGTLRQLITGPNLGLKVDWGTSVHGVLPMLEYEVALGRGSGMDFISSQGTWVVAGRLGTPEDGVTVFGLSGYRGHQLTPDGVIDRTRFGLDGRYYGPVDGMFEVSYGTDPNNVQVLNSLEELSVRSGTEAVMFYVQHRMLNTLGTAAAQAIVPGARLSLPYGFVVEANYERFLTAPAGEAPRQVLGIQLRERFALSAL